MMRPRRRTPTSPRERRQLVSPITERTFRYRRFGQSSKTAREACWNHTKALAVFLTPRDNRGRLQATITLMLLPCFIWILPFLSTRRVDHMLTYRVMSKVFPEQQATLKELGVDVPQTEIDYANNINTHAALREVLIVRERRAKMLQQLEQNALQCNASCFFPKVLLVPSVAGWSPLRPPDLLRLNLTAIRFDEMEMKQTVYEAVLALREHFGGEDEAMVLHKLFASLPPLDRIHLWALSAAFLYGGIFAGNVATTPTDVTALISTIAKATETNPTAVYVEYTTGSEDVPSSMKAIQLLASSPHSPVVACLLKTISSFVDSAVLLDQGGLLETFGDALKLGDYMKRPGWLKATFSVVVDGFIVDCKTPVWQELVTASLADSVQHVAEHTLFLHSVSPIRNEENRRPSVEIHPNKGSNADRTRSPKVRLQHKLRINGGEPGWLCNRCLNWALMGTFEKCSSLCPVKYEETLCAPSSGKPSVAFDVIVTKSMTHIPRIIHQTWFDNISTDRYPQLSRLQASWRSSGWDYRFYTDDDAREFIVNNYPEHFLDTFDVLVHGAYKADLFRYLVLLKEGGIYADVDVLLETDLDSFIQEGMTFFAPRDMPCEYAGEAFCLWNGVIGSSAGNPILVRAVERLVNLIQDRADVYDMEREVCLTEGPNFPVWKIRAQPLLFLSGPCGLGLAVNQALGRPSLLTLPVGYVPDRNQDATEDYGDTYVLVGDKYDLGQFRFSDSDRNIIFASTDIHGVVTSARTPMHATNSELSRLQKLRQPQQHYSLSKKGVAIWGSANVYKDDLASDTKIILRLKHVS